MKDNFMNTGLTQKEWIKNCENVFGGNNKKSTRELAIEWWNNLKVESQRLLFRAYSIDHSTLAKYETELTSREIEEIWRKENFHEENISITDDIGDRVLRPNQKQFKEFNAELFTNYMSKFSMYDKYNAIATALVTTDLSVDDIHTITTILMKYQKK